MTQTIRAIYRDGVFVPLEAVDIEAETVVIVRTQADLTPKEVEYLLRTGGLLQEFDDDDDANANELSEEALYQLGSYFATDRPVEKDIREDRDAR